ncbi:Chaperone protein [Wickerhamomyces ciferrii]|uniref:Chaperone protein n=1 Tax=Wickerhamomyces ciferrii (strain ATCC 14091 / BCRC 22168 / CBS 111 / JCM 3599 / NBRC 0793 / NRRL Y-1031 F-60-10) TaxID=1206466 RepID=K0KX69_WICCF|nr:Chaperone protein [Wickerhamomyces ciferrii]CCH46079.1 Chaperone protein [Wickerhamomyces ciferrii]
MIIRNCLILFTIITCALSAILGIDFGQDFTKSALIAPGVPFEIVLSSDSKRKEPSGLALKKLNQDEIERIYGPGTSSHCTRFPNTCLLNLKPLLGKSIDDPAVSSYISTHPGVKIVPSKNNRQTIAFEINNYHYPIEEIIAMSFQDIVSRASETLKEKTPGGYSQINDVVITIPSYFNQAQRLALKDSAELAGLKVIGLVDDGLAIAINYATNRDITEDKEYHIIYDMGSGSTTATLVSFTKNGTEPLNIKVEGYSHDESLGGSLFTNAVYEILKNKFLEQHSNIKTEKFLSNNRAIAKILQSSEKAKLVLSANNDASVSIESLYDDIDFRTKITREEFEEYVGDLSKRITNPILNIFSNQFDDELELTLKDVKSVIYAGGSTRIPFVQSHLLSLIGEDKVSKTINADESAVVGATLRGVQISKMFKTKQLNVSEASVYNYEFAISGDDEDEIKQVVFPKGSSYNQIKEIELTKLFNTSKDFTIDLYEESKLYGQYISSDVLSSIKKLDFNSSECSNGAKIYGKFKLSESRIFTLESIQARCEGETNEDINDDEGKSSGFFDKLKNKKDSQQQDDESNQKILKPKISNLKTLLPTKLKYASSRPLGSATKQELRSHLHLLNSKDLQRRQRSEKLNELEAILYKVRAFIEEEEVIEKGPSEIIENLNSKISEDLEWLDYDSDDATIKDIKKKIESIKNEYNQIEKFMENLNIPLDSEAFQILHKEGVVALNSIQDFILTMGETAAGLLRNFTEVGLDFEKESKKVKLRSPDYSQQEIEDNSKEFVQIFNKIKELYENPKILESKSREELFKLRTEALQKIEKTELIKKNLQSVESQRLREMNGILQRFFRAQRRAAAKAASKAKAEAEAEQTEATETTEVETATETNNVEEESTISEESEAEPTSTKQALEHDEL